VIGRATKNDGAALLALETACFSEIWSEKSLLLLLENPDYLTLLERDESGTARAYLIGWQIGEEAELARIGVRPAARGQGRSGPILKAALEIWRGQGARNVWLEVRESNQIARRLYASQNFLEVGKRANYYADGETALVLRLEL